MESADSRNGILIFVEDPGAINFIYPVVRDWNNHQHSISLFGAGHALQWNAGEKIPIQPVRGGCSADELLQGNRPQLVAVGTAESKHTLGLQLITTAQSMNIPCVGFVDAFANAAHRFRGAGSDPLQHAPDIVLVPDQATAAEFMKLGLEESRLKVSGHPHFDQIYAWRDQKAAEANITEAQASDSPMPREEVFFLAELSTAIGGQTFHKDSDYSLGQQSRFHERTEIVIEEFLAAWREVRGRQSLVLRFHPKNEPTDLAVFQPYFERVEQGGSSLEAIQDADLVVGMTTTLLDEAALLGIPTLSITPRKVEQEWSSSIRWGATVGVSTRDELIERLREFVETGTMTKGHSAQLPPSGATSGVRDLFESMLEQHNV